jgi:hypothetical protein
MKTKKNQKKIIKLKNEDLLKQFKKDFTKVFSKLLKNKTKN